MERKHNAHTAKSHGNTNTHHRLAGQRDDAGLRRRDKVIEIADFDGSGELRHAEAARVARGGHDGAARAAALLLVFLVKVEPTLSSSRLKNLVVYC